MITKAIIFAVFLIGMVLIGLKFYNSTNDLSDYFLGGRKLNSWVTAMSAQASDMSGWLLIGLPGAAYVVFRGTSEAIWTAIGLMLGTYLNWLFVAKRLRQYTEVSQNSLTLPDFFENRFRDSRHVLRTVSAVFTVIFFLIYTSSQFAAGGKLFSTVFGIDYKAGMVIGALIVLSYTALGGFTAVCWTDTIMGTMMFFALIAVPVMAVGEMGGLAEVGARLSGLTSETFALFPVKDGAIDSMLLASALGWGLGYFGQPHILARFMAISSPEEVKKSRVIAMIWVVITLSTAVLIGVIGKAFMPDLADGETIYMEMINAMFSNVVGGILLTAILAAIMSTASSQLLVAASSVSKDLYATLMKKDTSESSLVWISRLTVALTTAVAILLAIDPDSSVFGLVSCAWGGFGSAFGPLILFALFWRRMTRQGAVWGMISGGVADLFWYYMKQAGFGGVFNIYEIIPGFLISSAVIVCVSLLTSVPREITEEFDRVKNNGTAAGQQEVTGGEL
ncbi:sodium/proline symporter PutP [Bacilliculturomica massiliensis]|uniref:sodium/proline symporter PutP n=1 Tax=Bacilliculturomica massiliensis TaxID=1917867 RepID=UPI00102F7E37|nr:sodium/proline symporter PutP [Bacilliculturomica massiliensis]